MQHIFDYLDGALARAQDSGDLAASAAYRLHKQALNRVVTGVAQSPSVMPQSRASIDREISRSMRRTSYRRHMSGRGGRGRF